MEKIKITTEQTQGIIKLLENLEKIITDYFEIIKELKPNAKYTNDKLDQHVKQSAIFTAPKKMQNGN